MVIRMRVAVCVLGLGLALPTRAAAPERELSLEEVLQFAEQNAPEIAVAERRIGLAQATLVGASPWFPADPTLSIGGGGRVGGGQDGVDVGVGLSQAFEVFGEPGLRREVAERGIDIAKISVERARFNVHQLVHRSFARALVADADVDAADAAVAFASRLLEVAEARVKAGEASALTIRLAQTAQARAREQVLSAHEGRAASRLALGRDAGFTEATRVKPRGALALPGALPEAADLVVLADQGQPRLAVLRAQLDEARAAHALAEREGLPKPHFGAGYHVEGAAPGSSQTQHIVGATLDLPLPFFRGNDAERARTAAEVAVVEAELDGERRLLAGHIAEAWTRADAARARVALYAVEIVPGLDETLGLLEKAFSLGEIDLTEVMVGREQVLAARREALLAWRTWFDAVAALEAEVGAELPTSSSPSLPALP